MNNPNQKPSGFGDPERLALLEAASAAELEALTKKIRSLEKEISDLFLHLGHSSGLRFGHATAAFVGACATAIAAATMMGKNPEAIRDKFLDFLKEKIDDEMKIVSNDPLLQTLRQLMGAAPCSNDSSSPEASSPSSSISAESPSSSSGESKDA